MNTYRNKKTGAIIVIASEFGNNAVWEKIEDSPAPPVVKKTVKAETKEVKKEEAPKKTTARKAVKK